MSYIKVSLSSLHGEIANRALSSYKTKWNPKYRGKSRNVGSLFVFYLQLVDNSKNYNVLYGTY